MATGWQLAGGALLLGTAAFLGVIILMRRWAARPRRMRAELVLSELSDDPEEDGSEAQIRDALTGSPNQRGLDEDESALKSGPVGAADGHSYRRRVMAAAVLAMSTALGAIMLLFGDGSPPEVPPPQPPLPPPPLSLPALIIDTDMSFDVDDVGAVCLAHVLAARGEAEILAVGHNSGYPEAVGALSVLNDYFGRSDIPIGAYKGPFGVDKGGSWVTGPYIPYLLARFPASRRNSSQVDDAEYVYRRALASAADSSVTIVAIGFATNLARLLDSPPDRYSSLSGYELVARKVRMVTWQGGWYEPRHPNGHTTFNWDCGACCGYDTAVPGCLGAASTFVNQLPPTVEQVFSDLGDDVWHGGAMTSCAPVESPCRQAYIDTLGPGADRRSWDPIVVLLAVRGAAALGCSKADQGFVNFVDRRGANFWEERAIRSRQSRLAWDGEPAEWAVGQAAVGSLIDELLCTK